MENDKRIPEAVNRILKTAVGARLDAIAEAVSMQLGIEYPVCFEQVRDYMDQELRKHYTRREEL